jgi:hypothetical protein
MNFEANTCHEHEIRKRHAFMKYEPVGRFGIFRPLTLLERSSRLKIYTNRPM